MSWQVAAGAIGLLIAAGVVVWYKLKNTTDDVALARSATGQATAAHDLADRQLRAKDEKDRKALDEETKRVLAISDGAERQRAALELLARVRGVH